jgi:competence protein ComEA
MLSGCALLLLAPLTFAGPVDINTADAATIARELNGVGESRAQAIVDYRQKNGRFMTPEDVLKVSGIGPQVLKLNRDNIRTGSAGKTAPRPDAAN